MGMSTNETLEACPNHDAAHSMGHDACFSEGNKSCEAHCTLDLGACAGVHCGDLRILQTCSEQGQLQWTDLRLVAALTLGGQNASQRKKGQSRV